MSAPPVLICGLPGPRKVEDLPETWTCNRTPGHLTPHRTYDPRSFVILAEWPDDEVGPPKPTKRWGRR